MLSKVALVFVFNHKFDKNIDILEKLYSNRFSYIFHLVPFYKGNKDNVIPIYENSHYFQGYFAQGLKHYFNEDFEHYFFIGDDLILNPAINENNYKEYFKISETSAFIPEVLSLHNLSNNETLRFLPVKTITGRTKKWHWWRVRQLVKEYEHAAYGVTNDKEIPTYEQAEAIIKKHGYDIKPFNYYDVYGGFFPLSSATARFVFNLNSYFKKFKAKYPVVGSYSDIVIVPKTAVKTFCHYCGVFATNRLFVELAIPTALLLSCEEVCTEPALGKRGSIYWTYIPKEVEQFEKDMKQFNNSIGQLMQRFPEDKLYIHPIKLSRWQP